jgi:hypothetical protein
MFDRQQLPIKSTSSKSKVNFPTLAEADEYTSGWSIEFGILYIDRQIAIRQQTNKYQATRLQANRQHLGKNTSVINHSIISQQVASLRARRSCFKKKNRIKILS